MISVSSCVKSQVAPGAPRSLRIRCGITGSVLQGNLMVHSLAKKAVLLLCVPGSRHALYDRIRNVPTRTHCLGARPAAPHSEFAVAVGRMGCSSSKEAGGPAAKARDGGDDSKRKSSSPS